jgi:DNA-binding response OmpR family regulator
MPLATPTPQRAGGFGHPPNSNKKKILVVDDDAVVLRALSIKLEANGFDVLIAKEGGEAIRIVRTERPDLILLDISFPVNVNTVSWDGFLIMEWLKRLEEANQIPIVVISSGNSEKNKLRAREAGAAAFFHKPICHDQLFAYIRRKLNVRSPGTTRSFPARA